MRILCRSAVLRDYRADDLPVPRQWLRPHHERHQWDGPYFARPTDDDDATCASLAAQVAAGDWPVPHERLVVTRPDDDCFLGMVSWN